MTDFKVGDKVENGSAKEYTVAAGPFVGYSAWYAVEDKDGKVFPHNADNLTPIPATFAVGDNVEHRTFGPGVVAFGPFDHLNGPGHYLIKADDGTHMFVTPDSLTALKTAALTDYDYADVTYDLSAKYRDTDNDEWAFTGRSLDGGPEMQIGTNGFNISIPLAEVVDSYGPLTRI